MALSEAQALQAVKSVIASNGGSVEHGKLMVELQTSGAFEAQPFVRNFQQRGLIVGKLAANAGGKPQLTYSDPSAPMNGGGE